MKKVLITTGIYPPDIGGPATYSSLLLKELGGYDYEIKVLTYGAKELAVAETIYVVSNKWPKGLRHFIYFIKVLFLGWRADVILAADSSFGAAFISILAAKLIGKKIIVRVTGDYAWEQGQQRFGVKDLMDDFQNKKYGLLVELLRLCQKFFARAATAVIVPSFYLKKIVLKWGAKEEKIKVIYNSVDLADSSSTKEEARQKLGLEGKILVSIGRLVLWKGFLDLIEAAAGLFKEIADLKLLIIGDGPERKRLEMKIEKLGLNNRIFLIGAMAKNKLFEYLKAADVFVLNTAYEGFSHQIIEAMSLGLPVVTTAIGGNPEVIKNGLNGFLVRHGDKEELKAVLKRVVSNEILQKKIGASAKGASLNFSKEIMLDKIKELLNNI